MNFSCSTEFEISRRTRISKKGDRNIERSFERTWGKTDSCVYCQFYCFISLSVLRALLCVFLFFLSFFLFYSFNYFWWKGCSIYKVALSDWSCSMWAHVWVKGGSYMSFPVSWFIAKEKLETVCFLLSTNRQANLQTKARQNKTKNKQTKKQTYYCCQYIKSSVWATLV